MAISRNKTTAEICELFDVNRQTLSSWVRKGCPCTKPKTLGKGKQILFDQNEVAAWMKTKKVTGAIGRPPGLISDALSSAKLRKENALAEYHEMRVAKERGLLVDKAEQEQSNVKKFAVIRSKLLGLPSSVAPTLVGLEAPAIQNSLEDRIREMLTELTR